MSRKNNWQPGSGGLFLLVLVGLVLISCGDRFGKERNEAESSVTAGVYVAGDKKESPVFLYFGDRKKHFLIAEERILLHSADPIQFGKVIIKELAKGSNNGLMRTISADTALNALYIDKKTAYVDFSRALITGHPGGAVMENLTVYSIVNSLVLNIPEVEKVRLLIDGQEANTLAGHIDIRYPFVADMLLVR